MSVVSLDERRRRRERADDEMRVRRALRQANELVKTGDRRRLGALAVIFETLREAARIDRLLPGDRPHGDRSRWSAIEREVHERVADAVMRQQEIDGGDDPRIIFMIPATAPEVDASESVLRVFHGCVVNQVSDQRSWKILLDLVSGTAPAKIAERYKIKHKQQVSRIKMAALGRILTGTRDLLPPVDLPKRVAA